MPKNFLGPAFLLRGKTCLVVSVFVHLNLPVYVLAHVMFSGYKQILGSVRSLEVLIITKMATGPHISLHFKKKEIVSGIGKWCLGLFCSMTCGERRDVIFLWGKIISETVFDC